MRLIYLQFCWILASLAACGGGGGGGGVGGGGGGGGVAVNASSVSGLSTGYLIDSAVEGVAYTVTTKDGQTMGLLTPSPPKTVKPSLASPTQLGPLNMSMVKK